MNSAVRPCRSWGSECQSRSFLDEIFQIYWHYNKTKTVSVWLVCTSPSFVSFLNLLFAHLEIYLRCAPGFPKKALRRSNFTFQRPEEGRDFAKLSDSREGWTVSFTLKFYCTADQCYHEIRRLNIFNSENASLHLKSGNLPSTNPSESWFNINFSLFLHYKKYFIKSCSHKSTSNWSTDFSANCFKHSEPSADFISCLFSSKYVQIITKSINNGINNADFLPEAYFFFASCNFLSKNICSTGIFIRPQSSAVFSFKNDTFRWDIISNTSHRKRVKMKKDSFFFFHVSTFYVTLET